MPGREVRRLRLNVDVPRLGLLEFQSCDVVLARLGQAEQLQLEFDETSNGDVLAPCIVSQTCVSEGPLES